MAKLKKKSIIALINKIDLKVKLEKDKILKRFKNVIDISAKKSKNINLLEDAIAGLIYNGRVSACESIMVSNLRHIGLIGQAQKLIIGRHAGIANNHISIFKIWLAVLS